MKRVKSLDGLRGLSILIVVFGHCYASFLPDSAIEFLDKYFILDGVGVSLFFVLSGYLITKLLKIEEDKTGGNSLKNFYYKRLIRIFPAYYFYILCIYIYNLYFSQGLELKDFLGALFYTGWYYPFENKLHFFGHFWSLSVEEHFYFIFPLIFIFAKKHRTKIIIALIMLAPVVRILNYYFFPVYKAKMGHLTHTRYDMILWGCLLAEVESRKFINVVSDKFSSTVGYITPFIGIFIINPILSLIFEGKYKYIVSYHIDGLLISLIIILVMDERNKCNKFFENKILTTLGIYSYSIYIWQQVFAFKLGAPYNFIFIALMSYVSFNLVEKNFMRLRKFIT